MAEPLKTHFDDRIPRAIARQISRVWPAFRTRSFVAAVLDGYASLELMDRGRHIARVLRRYLPPDYLEALDLLLRSLGDRPQRTEGDGGMASFLYLPHVCFVAEFGLEHFEASMEAQYLLTQRFTAEFSIRPFIERDTPRALAMLRAWAVDSNPYVRRLVSEGTRPRLPWARRLRAFQQDPSPVIELLELLKDDPEPVVRRSVANNLNDIGKDHPDLLVAVAERWLGGATEERRALVRHALRSLVKQGHPGALRILGFGRSAEVVIADVRIAPKRVPKGGRVSVAFAVRSTSPRVQRVLVDLRIHFVKANGTRSPKVFKLKAMDISPRGTVECRKTVSIGDLTTRRHHVGRHLVDVLVNGRVESIGSFTIVDTSSG